MKLNRVFIALAALTLSMGSIAHNAAATDTTTKTTTTESLLIRNVHIVTADTVRPNHASAQVSKRPLNVLIKDERIVAIGTQTFTADKTIDGTGQYLIPGLIDTHVHLLDVPGLTDVAPDIRQQAEAQIPKSYLYAGFTTLLDLANTGEFIARWNRQPLAPEAFFCTPVLIPKGYPLAMMPEDSAQAHDSSRHLLHDHHTHSTADHNTDTHTPAELVEAGKKEGARCVKLFYEKGFGRMKNLPVPSEQIARELVAVAHDHKLPVFLHGNSYASYEFALATGVDMIVHGLWNADANITRVELNGIATRLAKAGIAVQPTIQVIYGEQEIFNPQFFAQPLVKNLMPKSLRDWYQSDAGQWMKKQMGEHFAEHKNLSDEQIYQQAKAAYQPLLQRASRVSSQLQKQKPLLVFGSDTPSGPFYTQFPGLNGRKEMDHWMQMGISLPDLFRAMTINNAQRMGLENEIGSVEKNKIANLLLLGKNPLEDITAYDSINWIILKGRAIERETLTAQ